MICFFSNPKSKLIIFQVRLFEKVGDPETLMGCLFALRASHL